MCVHVYVCMCVYVYMCVSDHLHFMQYMMDKRERGGGVMSFVILHCEPTFRSEFVSTMVP